MLKLFLFFKLRFTQSGQSRILLHSDKDLLIIIAGETAPGLIINDKFVSHFRDRKKLVIAGKILRALINFQTYLCMHKVKCETRNSMQYMIL